MKPSFFLIALLAATGTAHALPGVVCKASDGSELRATSYCVEADRCELANIHIRFGRGDSLKLYPLAKGMQMSNQERPITSLQISDPSGKWVSFRLGKSQRGLKSSESRGAYMDQNGERTATCRFL